MSEHPEDVQEATAAALREALETLPARLDSADNGHCTVCGRHRLFDTQANIQPCENPGCWSHTRRAALAGEPGRTFVAHMRRLETEGAAFRVAMQHLRYCGHGCSTACPHTRLFRQAVDSLALHGIRLEPLQSSAPQGEPA